MSIIIGIAHGYYAIKTTHCVLFCLWYRAAAYPAG